MTFDEWWATKDLKKAQVPAILKEALEDLAYEAWCESRYHQNLTGEANEHISKDPKRLPPLHRRPQQR